MPSIATNRRVDWAELKAFIRSRYPGIFLTTDTDNGLQSSLGRVEPLSQGGFPARRVKGDSSCMSRYYNRQSHS